MNILIIIPAYNEEENITNTVEAIKKTVGYDFVVINDGSMDLTAEICREANYPMLDLPVNLGLNGAFQTGIRYAWEHGYDGALQMDGDGQHRPEYIEAMTGLMENDKADIVIGSRFVSSKKPASMRMLGSNLIQLAIRLTTGKRITDPTSGMRLYNRRMLGYFARSVNAGPEPDTIAFLARNGASIKEIQVDMLDRTAGESMYVNPLRSIRYMINMFVSILLVQFFRKGDL